MQLLAINMFFSIRFQLLHQGRKCWERLDTQITKLCSKPLLFACNPFATFTFEVFLVYIVHFPFYRSSLIGLGIIRIVIWLIALPVQAPLLSINHPHFVSGKLLFTNIASYSIARFSLPNPGSICSTQSYCTGCEYLFSDMVKFLLHIIPQTTILPNCSLSFLPGMIAFPKSIEILRQDQVQAPILASSDFGSFTNTGFLSTSEAMCSHCGWFIQP